MDITNSFLASQDFFCLLITFSNSLDPDQDQQNVSPDLDPNRLTLIVFLKVFFEKVNLEKSQHDDNKIIINKLAGKEFIPIYQIYVEHSSLVGRGLDWRLKGC